MAKLPSIRISATSPLGGDTLVLQSFRGEEGISRLFHFGVELGSKDPAVDFAAVVSKGMTLKVEFAEGSPRFFHGIVTRMSQGVGSPGSAVYHADLRPKLYLLTQSANCKIFQNLSVPDIVQAVLTDHGVTDVQLKLTGSYAAREYCVQYNETAFAFISRLLEDEGIFYFFTHEDGKHTMVLADDASAFQPCPGATTLKYGTFDHWVQQTVVPHCTFEQNVIPGVSAVDDFNFETPTTDLEASVDSTEAISGTARRIYAYPGGFLNKGEGEALAKIRVQETDSPQVKLRGESLSPPVGSGFKFTMENHYRSDVNADWALERVAHTAGWTAYANNFDAFPASTPYRPARTTRKPVIPGTQTALVVGKAGEEIWTDKYGRVKVQFHWDQEGKNDENSSCWIRVAHGWAGKSWGQIFLPRIGQEVVVSFLEGDPDRPLITGSVYNAEQTVPYALPGEQTKSTIKSDSSKGSGGYNEMRFEDKKGEEEVYFQAEKDMNRVVKNNDSTKVGFEKKDAGNQTIDVYNDRTVTVEMGNEKLQVKKGDREVLVDTGNETHKVKGNRTLTVDGNLTIDVKGAITIKSGQSIEVTASMAITQKAGTSFTQTAGTSFTNEAGTSMTNKAGINLTNDAGVTMTNKAAASQTVDGGGMLILKGGLIKIN